MGKMMKQFARTKLSVMGLAVAATVLSSIPAQAAGPTVVTHALVPGLGFFTLLDNSNPASTEFVNVTVESTNTGFMLIYKVFDFGGGFSAGGSGSIPASSVNVSGGSVNTGKVTVTLNVDTCNVTGFTTTVGPCGTFNVTWVEEPASVGASIATRGDTRHTFRGGGEVETNGATVTFSALATGTALGFDLPTPTVGTLTQETNVTKTIAGPKTLGVSSTQK
jgi:hypothetical protein